MVWKTAVAMAEVIMEAMEETGTMEVMAALVMTAMGRAREVSPIDLSLREE